MDLDGYYANQFPENYYDETVQPVLSCIIIHGADFLTTINLKKMFDPQNPEIFWIDESNVKISFDTFEELKKSLKRLVPNKKTFL